MKIFFIIMLLLPVMLLAQKKQEAYVIYSTYLKAFQKSKKVDKMNFVMLKSNAYVRKYDTAGIKDIVTELERYKNGDSSSRPILYFTFKDFTTTVVKDTLWVKLIAELYKKMSSDFNLENAFSSDLQTTLIKDHDYKKYFKNDKHIQKNWERFHNQYTRSALLIDFSEIATDGQRAVFYFCSKCGGLCGEGKLVFFYKENNVWKYCADVTLWYS